MSIYLELAEEILRDSRQPMTAMQMLRAVYAREMAPWHLHGRTQHKTLQARLSEDILKLREKSRFYRTEPGRFFLREFLTDETLPEKFRKEIVARRRTRDLPAHRPLAVARQAISSAFGKRTEIDCAAFLDQMKHDTFSYISPYGKPQDASIPVWTASLVLRSASILSYRIGRYREDRDTFLDRRSIGFFTQVIEDDATLFDSGSLGILGSGLRTLAMDLNISDDWQVRTLSDHLTLHSFIVSDDSIDTPIVLAVISFSCPDDFIISSNRLAINDLEWLDLRDHINDVNDFDPWSQAVLGQARRIAFETV